MTAIVAHTDAGVGLCCAGAEWHTYGTNHRCPSVLVTRPGHLTDNPTSPERPLLL